MFDQLHLRSYHGACGRWSVADCSISLLSVKKLQTNSIRSVNSRKQKRTSFIVVQVMNVFEAFLLVAAKFWHGTHFVSKISFDWTWPLNMKHGQFIAYSPFTWMNRIKQHVNNTSTNIDSFHFKMKSNSINRIQIAFKMNHKCDYISNFDDKIEYSNRNLWSLAFWVATQNDIPLAWSIAEITIVGFHWLLWPWPLANDDIPILAFLYNKCNRRSKIIQLPMLIVFCESCRMNLWSI